MSAARYAQPRPADQTLGRLAHRADDSMAAGVPGLTDDRANVGGIARFVAPMSNVEWVEVLPFHQLGAFKWKALGLDYQLPDTSAPSPELDARVVGQLRDAGCRAR